MFNNYNSPQINTRSVVFNLMAINIVFFLISKFLPGLFPIHSPDMFLGLHYPASDYFKPFQIITHMFMHADVFHIFFNMFNLYMFGTILERVWGPKRFLEYFFMTGFGAMLLHTLVQAIQIYMICGTIAPTSFIINSNERLSEIINAPTIGASGAVFGLLTGFALLFANTELYLYGAIPVKAKYLVGGLIAYELFRGFSNSPSDNVAHFAHLGGALIGFIIIRVWNKDKNSLY
jgi:membrane associated rhomboid family serine protease